MGDLDCMSIEKFKLWSVNALKVFLACRKKSGDGTFDELAARAFFAWEEKIPVDSSAEEVELRLCTEYAEKLKAGGIVIPDPFTIPKKQWKGEKDGRDLWPSVYITDIAMYMNGLSTSDIVNQLMNEYKVGKGFRYFQCEWVKEVFIHSISDTHPHCILKARFTPSQCINNKDYNVWICVKKDKDNGVGGSIVSAYCTCTAGMLGSCNHIAGVLFCVEDFVKRGKATCTDKLSIWNVPKTKTKLKTAKMKDLVWKKGHYTKLNLTETDNTTRLKQEYTPLSKLQEEEIKDEAKTRQTLYDHLKDVIPESLFIGNMERRRYNKPVIKVPADYVSFVRTLKENSSLSRDDQINAFKAHLNLTDAEHADINKATIDQSQSDIWHRQRNGRLTASVFHRIATRVNTIRKDASTDPSKLVEHVLGQKPTVMTKAMKHGLSLEPYAKKFYRQQSRKKHKNMKITNTGLTLDKNNTFIAASADLEVTCNCCGDGLCEIKCPETIKQSKPTAENLDYLSIDKTSGQISLKENHTYYYQIQGQMGVCQKK